jgi:hypothetical protein
MELKGIQVVVGRVEHGVMGVARTQTLQRDPSKVQGGGVWSRWLSRWRMRSCRPAQLLYLRRRFILYFFVLKVRSLF